MLAEDKQFNFARFNMVTNRNLVWKTLIQLIT